MSQALTLTLNRFLEAGELSPAGVRLVRHKSSHDHRALFDSALRGDDGFRHYQETQSDPRVVKQFRKAEHLAGFVVDPLTKQTVFMGVWQVHGERPPTIGLCEGTPGKHAIAFQTKVLVRFDGYRGRLIIEWGGGERAWVQRADKRDKPIVEIRAGRVEHPFPGYLSFWHPLAQIMSIPVRWQDALRATHGIYLLAHRKSGDQYVGSAYGADGFFGRWSAYRDGHGGNVALRELAEPASSYDVGILEVIGSDSTAAQLIAREGFWKTKLGTRAKGLNRN